MKKNIIIGVAIIGGLLIIAIVLPESKPVEITPEVAPVETARSDTSNVSLSADLSVFPLYPNAQLKKVQDTDGETARDVSVSLSTRETKEDIFTWYRNALSSNGWSIKSDKNVAGYQIIQGENKNLYTSLQAASGSEPGEVVISQHLKVRK